MENLIEKTKQLIGKDRFAIVNGITLEDVSTGTATAKMTINEQHLNGLGTVQGGAIFTLADLAAAAASNSYGVPAVALSCNISFIKAAKSGVLTANASEVYRRRTVAGYEVRITDQDENLIAVFNSTTYIKN
ncbi:MAG: hotdog fold thioesterase [Bacteroidales bacterium]|nr:hotdog fold thioesterase [Bacteroidales bacterium]